MERSDVSQSAARGGRETEETLKKVGACEMARVLNYACNMVNYFKPRGGDAREREREREEDRRSSRPDFLSLDISVLTDHGRSRHE